MILYLNGKDFKWQSYPMFSWLRVAVGLTPNANGFEEYLPFVEGTITTIIIDHFEDLLNVPDARPLIVGLTRESRETKRFNILVAVSSALTAREILFWNGNSKIRLATRPDAARWDVNIARDFALGSPLVKALNDTDAAEVVEYAAASGSPGKLEDLASVVFRKRVAEVIIAEWEAGIQILSPYSLYD